MAGSASHEEDPIAHAKLTGKVLRCYPTGDQYIDFKFVAFDGPAPGQWVKTFENWGESVTVEESGVRYVFDLSEPAYDLIDEEASHFEEMRQTAADEAREPEA